MKIEVNIDKKYFFILLSAIIVLAGVFAVYAYRSGQAPSVLGHSAEELEVNISGSIYTLQQAINNNLIGASNITTTVTFYDGILASGAGAYAYTKNIGKHKFCAMSLSSNADDGVAEWKSEACNILKNAEGNWTIITVATNGYYSCGAVCFD